MAQRIRRRSFKDQSGQIWSQFDAANKDIRLSVREIVKAQDGTQWPDIGYWYWRALWQPDAGPWTSYLTI